MYTSPSNAWYPILFGNSMKLLRKIAHRSDLVYSLNTTQSSGVGYKIRNINVKTNICLTSFKVMLFLLRKTRKTEHGRRGLGLSLVYFSVNRLMATCTYSASGYLSVSSMEAQRIILDFGSSRLNPSLEMLESDSTRITSIRFYQTGSIIV